MRLSRMAELPHKLSSPCRMGVRGVASKISALAECPPGVIVVMDNDGIGCPGEGGSLAGSYFFFKK